MRKRRKISFTLLFIFFIIVSIIITPLLILTEIVLALLLLSFFLLSIFFTLKIYYKMNKMKATIFILSLLTLLTYLYLSGDINSSNFGILFFFYLPMVGLFSLFQALLLQEQPWFLKKPNVREVIRAVSISFFIIIIFAAFIMLFIAFERFIIFPAPQSFYKGFLSSFLFYIIANVADPLAVVYGFMKPIVILLKIFNIESTKPLEELVKEKKRENKGKKLPLGIVLGSSLPFLTIYFVIFLLFRVWENLGFTVMLWSFFLATMFVISNLRYKEKTSKSGGARG